MTDLTTTPSEDTILAVKTGIHFLDTAYPEWLGKISVDDLNLGLPRMCVLGQVVRSLDTSTAGYNLFERFLPAGRRDSWLAEHGFKVADDVVEELDSYDEVYGELTDAWKAAISERLSRG